jgi:hypothetical protein
METITIQELIEYRAKIEQMIKEGSTDVIRNGSVIHAAIVQSEILQNAMEYRWPVSMYCGAFSLYQDLTKTEMDALAPELQSLPESEHPYHRLLKTLTDFFKSGGTMNVVLDGPLKGLSKQQVWKTIHVPLINGRLRIRALPAPVALDHFTVAGSMYRRERSDETKEAVCCFQSERAETLRKVFDILSTRSEIVDVR